MDFERPVDVGDLVTFESRVIHTRLTPQMGTPCDGPPPVQLVVQVRALVNQPERVQTFATNTFTMMCAPQTSVHRSHYTCAIDVLIACSVCRGGARR